MASDTVYTAVKTYLTANWTTTKLVFDNENFASDGTTRVEDSENPWVMVEMTGDFREQASIGAGSPSADLYREEGQIFLTVMVKSGSGSRVARQYARQLADLFKGLEIDGALRFRDASIGLGEKFDRNGNWYGIPVSINFQSDQ